MDAKKPKLSPEERRERRAERRARQRAANEGRAQKMHLARIASQAGREAPRLSNLGAATEDSGPPRLNVGCSGWFYWQWKGNFYPPEMKTSHWFGHYASHFDTVELNAPFYSWPTAATVQSWVRQAEGRRFTYTVKACELITHVKQFAKTAELVRDFGYIRCLLKPHMGCFLFQLPPSFRYTPARLKRILDQLDPTCRNVVEFRHESWWNKHVFNAFKKTNTIFCSCSAPRLPDELVQTSDEVYIRFHGPQRWYRHNYTSAELTVWTNRVRDRDPARVWAYFNNDYGGYAIQNARDFLRLLRKSSIAVGQNSNALEGSGVLDGV